MTLNELITLFARYIHRINDIDIVQKCGLAEGTSANTLKTTNAIVYQIYNQQYTLAITDNIAMTACAAQPALVFCYYLVSVNVSGTVTVTKGTDSTYALPACPAGNAAIGALKITTATGVTFTSGTDDLSKTGVTDEYFDIDCGIATTLINNAQRKIENGIIVNINGSPVRVSNFDHMLVRSNTTIVSGDYVVTNPIPNYKELVNAHIVDSDGTHYPELRRMGYDEAIYCSPIVTDSEERPKIIARYPTVDSALTPDQQPVISFLLRPTSDDTYTLDIAAYQYSPTLDGVIYTTNWWTQSQPDILLLASLVEAEPYLRQDERMATWEKKLAESLAGLAGSQRAEKYSGSKLNINYYDPFGRYTGNIYSFTGF